jgi:hypothetical protein
MFINWLQTQFIPKTINFASKLTTVDQLSFWSTGMPVRSLCASPLCRFPKNYSYQTRGACMPHQPALGSLCLFLVQNPL